MAFAVCASLGVAALVPMAASASGNSVTTPAKALAAHNSIGPGDLLNFGYVVSMGDHSPGGTVYVNSGQAQVHYSCTQNGSFTPYFTILFPAPKGIAVPANDNHWHATEHPDAAAGYEVAAPAPDACKGGPMFLVGGDKGGVIYAASLSSTDASDPVNVEFHGVDARSQGNLSQNFNCGDPSANPNGGGNCNGSWSQVETATPSKYSPPSAAPTAPPSSSSNPPPSSPSQPPSSSQPAPTGGGSSTSGGSSGGSGSTATSGSGSSTTGTSGSGSTSGTGHTGGGTSGSSTTVTGSPSTGSQPISGMVVVGSSTPSSKPAASTAGGVQGLSTHAPASQSGLPQAGTSAPVAAQAIANTVLGPVPMVVPTIADALSRAGAALPWNWFLALGLVDALLMALIVVRRRRAATNAA